jgi:hypothetical protein
MITVACQAHESGETWQQVLTAVFEVVERDHAIGPAMCDSGPHPSEPLAYCELPRGHKGTHTATVEKAVDW